MTDREHGVDRALPLAEAAARLGLSRDALRMRIRRGKAKGFKRGGQVYVWLDETARAAPAQGAGQPAAPPTVAPAVTPEGGAWPALAELQKQEIARLIAETERLNARLDRHLDELSEMRRMLQREQVLRQQEQALRRDVQNLLERLIAHPALAAALGPAAGRESAPLSAPLTAEPAPGSEPGPEAKPTVRGARGRDDSLAAMLQEIGQSLRALEADGLPEGPSERPRDSHRDTGPADDT